MSMGLFAVVAIKGQINIKVRLDEIAPKNIAVKNDVWLAAFDGTARELSEKLGIRAGETGSGVVVAISGWAGRASKDLWDWIEANRNKE